MALYAGKTPDEDSANFFGMIHNLDLNVGKMMAWLEDKGLDKNTLVIMINDNGGTAGVKVFNAAMHGAKGSPWLGGTRGFSFWRLPGAIKPADCGALTTHLDFFRTLAALAGAELPPNLQEQAKESRNLLPLLENPSAPWEDRHLFTHVGRWPKGTDPDEAKFNNCAVRNTRYTLVNETKRGLKAAPDSVPHWQLFDVIDDPAQSRDIAGSKPEVVTELSTAYDAWWSSLRGHIDINEKALGPKLNPFAAQYWRQFGGGPSKADYERMDPAKAMTFESRREKGRRG
ncbi:MAG: Arylsulfatase [Verrucomicrobiaceae bacterium]|nr:Arylsulfatase [Verrucomicrobiaceae bacterium]